MPDDNVFNQDPGKAKQKELGLIFDVSGITDSMGFKTGMFVLKMGVMIVLAVVGGFIAPGLSENFSFMGTIRNGSAWMKTAITFLEQTWACSAACEWFTAVLMRSDSRLVGKKYKEDDKTPMEDRDIGLTAEFDNLSKEAGKDPDALERGRKVWNHFAKVELYQKMVQKWLTKLQIKLRKARSRELWFIPWFFRKPRTRNLIRKRDEKTKVLEDRIKTTISLLDDNDTIRNIDYLTIKGFSPMLTKDLENARKVLFRGVAQLGSALALGARCRVFKSLRPDQ